MLSRKPWRGEFVLLFCAAQFLCVFAGAVVISLLHKLGVSGFKNETDFGNILFGTLCFQGVTWILIPIFLRLHRVGWRDAFDLRGLKFLPAVLLAVAAMFVILPVALELENMSAFVLEKIGWPVKNEAAVELVMGTKTLWAQIYLGVFTIVLAPVAEEFIFRGILFPFVKQLGYPRVAWLGVSAFFALVHFDIAIFVPLFALALALTWLYEKTDCLLAPIAAHSLFNAVNLLLLQFQEQINEFLLKMSHFIHL